MAIPVQKQAMIWSSVTIVVSLVLWQLGNVILPFVLGAALAYFLDPLADRLEAAGMSRVAATVAISFGALLTFLLAAVLLIPLLVDQSRALVEVAPRVFTQLTAFLSDNFPFLGDLNATVRDTLTDLGETIRSRGGEFVNAILGSAQSVINIVTLIVIVPVVAFYLLLDWDNMIARIDRLLPREHAPKIRELAGEVNQTVAAFIRGMGTVCLVMGAYYAIGLMAVGLQFGLVVGAIAGLVTFIPYVGALLGGALALGLALFQFWGDWVSLGLVAGIFVLGQALEGNVITPRLVGRSVGLHPVWLLLALSVFGSLFGFVGMLVAVPLAAAIGVLVRHGTSVYLDSTLYTGVRPSPDDPASQTSTATNDDLTSQEIHQDQR